jgi:hypothetical protein
MKKLLTDEVTPLVVDIEACEKVKDWAKPWEAGLSCAVTYHPTDLFRIWQPDEVRELAAYLNAADLVVGYASKGYDVPVIETLSGTKINVPQYDLCEIAAETLKRRVKANEVFDATLGLTKTGEGADAPTLWQQGRLAELWAYCTNDVLLEYLLFRHARDHGYLLAQDKGRIVVCPAPKPDHVCYPF